MAKELVPEENGTPGNEDGKDKPRKRSLRYTETRRRRFLTALAESYDTAAALKQAELSWPDVCELRVRYPEFAARMDEVIVAGFDRLEADFLRVATAQIAAGKADAPLVLAVMKLRRPARAPASAAMSARDKAERARRVDRIMSQVAQIRAGQAGGSGDGGENRHGDAGVAGNC